MLENVGVGKAKAINALFYVADEEAVGAWAFSTKHLDDFVLGSVDVLVFVDEDEPEFFAPMAGDGCGLAGDRIPQESESELFKVVEIQGAELAFGLGESLAELGGKTDQRGHLRANPVPVLSQGIEAVRRGEERAQESGLIEEGLKGFKAAGLFALGVLL